MSVDTNEAVLTVTSEALEKVLELRAEEEDSDGLGLRIEIVGVSGYDFAYDLSFEPLAECADDDLVHTQDGLPVVIPAASADDMRGSTLDLPANDAQGGLVLRNPNRPSPLSDLGDLELSGAVDERVKQLLDQAVNPGLAAHGGFAELKKVENGDTAHVLMGGGCQGCAVSAMTLRDGIERAILEHVPEITTVVDATDHDAGENPYY